MTSLLKSTLDNSIANAVYNEIQNRSARYYYFLGKTISWVDEITPPYPIDSFNYELATRNEIITLKEITSTDVAFVIPRKNWITNVIWDMYDDQYSTELQGINLLSGGSGYSSTPIVTITGGSGSGATAIAVLTNSVITSITLTARGIGYTSLPSVTITGGGGSLAVAAAVVTIAPSGVQRLEDTNSYVLTDEFNVYRCLDNNNNALSTYKPIGTVVDPVIMPDGYMWKYLYTIPIALRNKFLTDIYMPVVNSIRSQFYSGGEILNIKIDNAGQNYSFANINVVGDGYRESDPLLLTSITISNAGSGYSSVANLTIASPFGETNPWIPGTGILLGQKVEFANNIYECTVSGTTASPGPTHKFNIVANGTAALKYIGTRATGTLIITSGIITGYILNGQVYDILITNGGLGYSVAPTVNISGGGGSNFVGRCIMNGTSVSRVSIINSGDNFTSVPTITFGTSWTANTPVTVNQQIFVPNTNKLYTVITAGTTSSNAPSITGTIASIPVTTRGSGYTSSPTFTVSAPDVAGGNNAVITAVISDSGIASITISSGGTGYINPPSITFTGGGGTGLVLETPVLQTTTNGSAVLKYAGVPATGDISLKYGSGYSSLPKIDITPTGATGYFVGVPSSAKLIPLIVNGQIKSVQIDNGGVGYTYANLSITGDGTSAQLSADLSPGDINTLQANTELLTLDGRVMAYPVISGGYGYGSDFNVIITGDGTGATAIARVVRGKVNKIEVTNYGIGYRWCTVSFAKGSGNGASARGIIAPYGGHGKDSITNLFAKKLMFFSNISKDSNQGFVVNNDFRQLGIIKNPRKFGQYGNLASSLASACYVVTAFINITNFTQDMLVTFGTPTGPRFRIVAITTTGVLLQSLDNIVPIVGNVFINPAGNTFSVSGVTAPTADKYSGNLLFIDNKIAFTPTADQNVTLRTIINF